MYYIILYLKKCIYIVALVSTCVNIFQHVSPRPKNSSQLGSSSNFIPIYLMEQIYQIMPQHVSHTKHLDADLGIGHK